VTTHDGLDFVERSLATLPRDPSRCSLEDLRTLAAVQEGFTRHTLRLEESMAQLEQATRGDLDDGALHAALRQRRDLHSAEGRTKLAEKRLAEYTRSALAAHNVNLADHLGDNRRRPT
jgi:hypothetical protein